MKVWDAMFTLKRLVILHQCNKGVYVCMYVIFYVMLNCRIQMIAKLGTFVEYSVFTKEVQLDWTIIGDTKGTICHNWPVFCHAS